MPAKSAVRTTLQPFRSIMPPFFGSLWERAPATPSGAPRRSAGPPRVDGNGVRPPVAAAL